MPQPRLMIGAMSGTSADGVDAALVETTGVGLGMTARYVAHVERAYDADLRRRIFALRETGQASMADLAELGRDITLAYAAAVRDLLAGQSVSPNEIGAVAAHGQTLYHAPPQSIQWLDPSLLARETTLAVVSDFRRADLAAGGQGAPLVPFADWILFRHPTINRVILNLGGIANLTWLPAGGGIDDVIAFDTGPGCCLSDWLMRTYRPGGPGRDEGGARAADGHPRRLPLRHPRPPDVEPLLAEWFAAQPYFRRPPPKSTDTAEMIALWTSAPVAAQPWLGRCRADSDEGLSLSLHEAALAVWHTLAHAFADFLPAPPDEVIVAGGGTRNAHLMGLLGLRCPSRRAPGLCLTDDLGVPSQAREAVAFALLGAATLDGEPSNVPTATGARSRVVLGSITPRPHPGTHQLPEQAGV